MPVFLAFYRTDWPNGKVAFENDALHIAMDGLDYGLSGTLDSINCAAVALQCSGNPDVNMVIVNNATKPDKFFELSGDQSLPDFTYDETKLWENNNHANI
jgi:hypothetical protein